MTVPRSNGKVIKCKLRIDCPFCGWATVPGKYIKLSRGEKWMHPRCADYADVGKKFSDLQYDRQLIRSIRRSNEAKAVPAEDRSVDYF